MSSLHDWLEKQYNKETTSLKHRDPLDRMNVYSLLNYSIRQDQRHDKKRSLQQPRKRGGPVDINAKRQRNTAAARRSRLRKAIKMETMKTRVDTLKIENDRLHVRMAVLETEVSHVAEKEARNRQRLLELEAQLALVQKQLVE